MIEIIYGENSQQADLAGKSVAEVRELYASEFSISDRAKASLNGEPLKKKLEPETKLADGDQLYFEEKSRRGLVVLGALLLTLFITGGLFAYAAITTSTEIGVTAVSADFAEVSENNTLSPASYTILGRVRGKIGSGNLFDVTRTSGYTGDIEVNLYLANIDELTQDYSFWMLRLELTDINGSPVDKDHGPQVLSLNNASVSFACDNWTETTRYIECEGGSYRALPSDIWSGQAYDPLIFCQVNQAGSHP